MTLRTYTLYPGGRTGFTNKSIAYDGTSYKIAASSIKQAYYVAHNRIWITGANDSGIISIYTRTRGHLLWDGCVGHGRGFDLGLGHSDGTRRITDAIKHHMLIAH